MNNVTPSAEINVPLNKEHLEARQDAVNNERNAYVSTLPPEEKARFNAVEMAVSILEKNGIEFVMWVKPGIRNDEVHAWWQCNKMSYLEEGTVEWKDQYKTNTWKTMWFAIQFFAKRFNLAIPVYTINRELVGLEAPRGFFEEKYPSKEST